MTNLENLERQKDDMKAAVALRTKAIKLSNNKEFKELILDGFCRDEAARYAHLSVDPAIDEESRADALGMAQAGGYVRRWLSAIVQMANNAESNLVDIEEAIEELRVSEDNTPGGLV